MLYLDTPMNLSILTWSKPSKPIHLMPLSMPLSLDHLEHVMGLCWCFWAGPIIFRILNSDLLLLFYFLLSLGFLYILFGFNCKRASYKFA